jgi:hypothetical protein
VGVPRESIKLIRVPTISHISTCIRKFIVIILANDMADIAGDAPQLFMFTLIRNLHGDMWDDAGSGIAHLSPLILMLARRYPFDILYRLG